MTLTSEMMPEQRERPLTRVRIPYGAVPLEPWRATYPGSEGLHYSNASFDHIKERLDENIVDAIERGVIDKDYRFESLYEFVRDSLFDAQNRRINFNNAHHLPGNLYPTEEYVNAALEGTATPEELLRLMLEHDMDSIELAKLSHPFDFEATRDMNTAVLEAEKIHGFTLRSDKEPRYKAKRIDRVLGGLIVVKKDIVASKQIGGEMIEVVRRGSLLVLDGEDCNLVNSFIQATESEGENRLQPDEAVQEFSGLLTALLESPLRDELTWLFPTTTSYYVRRRPITEQQGHVQEA